MNIVLSKLARAEQEINILSAFIANKIRLPGNRAILKARHRYDTQCDEIYIAEIPDLGDFRRNVSITVGMIVHLIRSSLDNLAFSLAMRNTGNNVSNPRSIQFPICDDLAAYRKDEKRYLTELSVADRLVIGNHQPFHGAAGRPDNYSGPYIHQLSLLRDISNADKHREVVEISIDPNHFEYFGQAVPISAAWSKWARENCDEYFAKFRPPLMRVGELVQRPIHSSNPFADEFHAGYATACVAMEERRPVASSLARICQYVELLACKLGVH